ncbi:SDR family oxidoreductase [Aneurinibacillus sp. BA2021]|nr:SDR family oxidoreductase [Aneurinibacillus sp. BA2021]
MQGKTAIITGGARGIGAAAAKLLASRGARVAVNYVHNHEAAEQTVFEIKANGGEAIAVQADVREEAQVNEMVKIVQETYGSVDILVSNANMSFAMKPFMEMSWDEFSTKLNDELKAAFVLTKAVAPLMMERKYGRIIYIASGLAKSPSPMFIAHGTAKGGLVSFAKYIAQELGPHGITANIVSPGLVLTDATTHTPENMKQMLAAMTPLGRIAQPEDVARAIAMYAGDDSGFITGAYTPVNGGHAME